MSETTQPEIQLLPGIFIKNVAIKINSKYNLDNTPFRAREENSAEKKFIGRRKIKEKVLEFLKNGGNSGVYLITGYRGMGKTSFIFEVLNDYNKWLEEKQCKKDVAPGEEENTTAKKDGAHKEEKKACTEEGREKQKEKITDKVKENEEKPAPKPPIIISLALTQNTLTEEMILKNIVSKLYAVVSDKNKDKKKFYDDDRNIVVKYLMYALLLLIFPALLFIFPDKVEHFFSGAYLFKYVIWLAKVAGVAFFLMAIGLGIMLIGIVKNKEVSTESFKMIEKLYKRCYSSYSIEHDDQKELAIETLSAKILTPAERETFNYPLASAKEIEHILDNFFKVYSKEENTSFIFIFDELDKIDPPAITTSYNDDLESFQGRQSETNYLQQLRTRKQTIINIIAALKNFLTTTQARFFFIAGREMFDASLADIADRESSLGSIFNYVFYVESFLKETGEDDNNTSLSQSIEQYLNLLFFNRLSNEDKQGKDVGFYKNIKNQLDAVTPESGGGLTEDEKNKIIVIIQNYVSYLTYRSNGSPKKLIKAVHEFIRVDKDGKWMKAREHKTIVAQIGNTAATRYLYFNFNDQYRIGFINYLYRPFLIKYGRSFKNYSDNIISSTPYLFDHLFKFHPFAFSLENLELIPEVLSTTKTPSLREHIKKIIDYLYKSHIRETEISLFDYKFYSRIVYEVSFISKTFELENAAFNFTLDESYLVKLHVRTKLKELRGIHAAFITEKGEHIQSIFYMNTVLGDLHFFDEEYDDAIVAYADALKSVSNISRPGFVYLDFISAINCYLKLGLVFEKIKSYKMAHFYYTDAANKAQEFILQRVNQLETADNKLDENILSTSSLIEVLQISNQAFLAQTIVQEKYGSEGISSHKLLLGLSGYIKTYNKVAEIRGEQHSEHKPHSPHKSYLIFVNMFLVAGNLMFFKNTLTGLDSNVRDKVEDEIKRVALYREYVYNIVKDENEKNEKVTGEISKGTKRQPITALALYLAGLEEIFKSASPYGPSTRFNGISWKNGSMCGTLFSYVKEEAMLDGHRFSKNHYKYIAILLSNIGNCILSMVKTNTTKNVFKINASEIFDIDNYRRMENSTGLLALDSGFFECIRSANRLKEAELKVGIDFKRKEVKRMKEAMKKETSPDIDTENVFTVLYFEDKIKGLEEELDALNEQLQKLRPSIADVLNLYYISALYFDKAGRDTTSLYQLKKILYVIRMVLHENYNSNHKASAQTGDDINDVFIEFIDKFILKPALRIGSKITEFSDGHMINKLQKTLGYSNHTKHYIINNISNHPETREAIMIFEYIKVKVLEKYTVPPKLLGNNNSIASQFTRLVELDYYQKYTERILNSLDEKSDNYMDNYIQECANLIYSFLTTIHILNIYGISYTISFNYLAHSHFKLAGFVSSIKTRYPAEHVGIMEKINERLVKAIGKNSSYVIEDVKHHFSMAKDNYEKAIRLHTVGNEYKNAIDEIIYLEDDINDNAYHFGAAMERFLYTNNVLENSLETCNERIREMETK